MSANATQAQPQAERALNAVIDEVWRARDSVHALTAVIRFLAANDDEKEVDALKISELIALFTQFRDGMRGGLDRIEAIAKGEKLD